MCVVCCPLCDIRFLCCLLIVVAVVSGVVYWLSDIVFLFVVFMSKLLFVCYCIVVRVVGCCMFVLVCLLLIGVCSWKFVVVCRLLFAG